MKEKEWGIEKTPTCTKHTEKIEETIKFISVAHLLSPNTLFRLYERTSRTLFKYTIS